MSNELSLASVYRKAAVTFLLLTLGLLALVIYVVLPKALIVVTPSSQTFEKQYFFTIGPEVNIDEDETLYGAQVLSEVILEESFKGSGIKERVESLTGRVTLINNYSKNQPLIKTTRLLTDDGVLLRLSESVTIPIGGSVEANVYLDEETKQVDEIPSGRLTIPGLWEGIQDKIYAEIKSPLTGKIIKNTIVTNDDITIGQNTLRDKADELALEELTNALEASQIASPDETNTWQLATYRFTEERWDIPDDILGSATSTFVVVGAFTLEGVFYNTEVAENKITKILSTDEDLSDLEVSEVEAIITNTELSDNNAEVMTTVKGEQKKFDKDKFFEKYFISGLTIKEAINYLRSQEEISEVEIELSPFWVKKIPKRKVDLVVVNK